MDSVFVRSNLEFKFLEGSFYAFDCFFLGYLVAHFRFGHKGKIVVTVFNPGERFNARYICRSLPDAIHLISDCVCRFIESKRLVIKAESCILNPCSDKKFGYF